jgi:hypothetical protein
MISDQVFDMNLGDIEGKGKVYDGSGQIIFHDEECITKSVDGNVIGIYKRHKAGWKVIFMDGPGCAGITNLRTVFLREPKSYAGGQDNVAKRLYSLSDGQYWPDKEDHAKREGAKDFFEVYHDEVKKIKHGKKESTIFTESDLGKHKIILDTKIAKELEKILVEGGML